MNSILPVANDFLQKGNFTYAICGGFALDIFTNTEMRVHSDIDICVFENDKEIIFQHMQINNWSIYEFQGQGIVRLIKELSDCQNGKNLVCVKENCEIIKFYLHDRNSNYFHYEFCNTGIRFFNYVEFLFNTSKMGKFIFDSKTDISRDMNKAILHRNYIPYLSPDLVLLYKSKDFNRNLNQFDFEKTFIKLDTEQKLWFYSSLDKLFPCGHQWRL